eukprot:TRINITY_DN8640_c0_g1_i1.p1 TRINITY_DN8640_c0_g1~~TRINITY_DN8640_c0_g1_i1.p1  ORF type:complete len:602 (+),score=200.45 TRINITY_DN8640_c0_g1_i1:90-1895(+)
MATEPTAQEFASDPDAGGHLPDEVLLTIKLKIQGKGEGGHFGVCFDEKGRKVADELLHAFHLPIPKNWRDWEADEDDNTYLNWFEEQLVEGFPAAMEGGFATRFPQLADSEGRFAGFFCKTDSSKDGYPRITRDFLLGLKAEGLMPVELRDKKPSQAAAGAKTTVVGISGRRSWASTLEQRLHSPSGLPKEKELTLWVSMDLKPPNPFYPPTEAGCCTKRTTINHLVKILRFMSFIDVPEDEDQETEEYREMTKILLFGGKVRACPTEHSQVISVPRYLPEGSPQWLAANAEECRVLPFEDEMEDGSIGYRFLTMPETDDWYEVQHRNYMRHRIRIEMRTVSEYCVKMFYSSIAEFILGCAVFAIGMLENRGGDQAVMIACLLAGTVMAVGGTPLGLLASLSGNESQIQKFFAVNLMILSFLTVYLYVELKFTWDNTNADNPGWSSMAPAADTGTNKEVNEIKNSFAIAIAAGCLFVSFLNVYLALQAMDTLNDLSALQDEALVFRYFQVRFTEMKKTSEQMCKAQYKQLGLPGPESMTQAWTRSDEKTCGANAEKQDYMATACQSPAVTSGVVINWAGVAGGEAANADAASCMAEEDVCK